MSEENLRILGEGFGRLAEQGEPDLDLIDPEIEIVNFDSFPVTRPYHGHAGLLEWLADMSEPFEDFRFELVEVLADDEARVVASLRATGRSRSGGPPFALEWAAIYTFRHGRLVRAEGYRTPDEALRAARLGP